MKKMPKKTSVFLRLVILLFTFHELYLVFFLHKRVSSLRMKRITHQLSDNSYFRMSEKLLL